MAEKSKLSMLDNMDKSINKIVKPEQQKKLGPPKRSKYDTDARLTIRLPGEVHLKCKLASAMSRKPMTDIVIEALIEHLKKYENL